MAIRLRNGISMPLVGFGTFKVRGREVLHSCLDAALRSGYRSIDTAEIYRNEEDIGLVLEELLPKHNLTRNDIFLTSKLSPKSQGYESCLESVKKSLQFLKTDALDLYLIHWPGTSGKKVDDPANAALRQESWKALEQCHDRGWVKSIGVSNYCLNHLEEMKSYATVMPHVLQVEHHPHYVQTELRDYCLANGIHYQAYSSLGTTSLDGTGNALLNDPSVLEISHRLNKSPAQVLLKWAHQQNIGVLPKSLNAVHIEENIRLTDFVLEDDDFNRLGSLNRHRKYAWDPSLVV